MCTSSSHSPPSCRLPGRDEVHVVLSDSEVFNAGVVLLNNVCPLCVCVLFKEMCLLQVHADSPPHFLPISLKVLCLFTSGSLICWEMFMGSRQSLMFALQSSPTGKSRLWNRLLFPSGWEGPPVTCSLLLHREKQEAAPSAPTDRRSSCRGATGPRVLPCGTAGRSRMSPRPSEV